MKIYPQPLETPLTPPQNTTYSQAVRLGGVLYLSGQLGTRRDGSLPDSFAEQVRQALENVESVLDASGSSLAQVAKVNIYITDFANLGAMNQIYPEFFPHRPAKTTVEIARLDKGAMIEIEVTASV